MTNRRQTILLIASLAAAAATTALAKGGDYHPEINPANFSSTVDNPYYPLTPGTAWKLVEGRGKDAEENEIAVTHDTKVIMGVTCVVVHDVVRAKGKIKEDTFDWFAQDKEGNVWYFGEDTKEFGPGKRVTTEGSWTAGINQSFPGIIMPAKPVIGQPYRQEYGPGVAEDMSEIQAVNEAVTVPYGHFDGCIETKEWSLLEAGTDHKWYAKGVGFCKEVSADKKITVLVSMTRP